MALAINDNGTPELVGTDGAGGVWHTSKVNGNWLSYSQLNFVKTVRHIAASLTNQRIHVVGVDQHGDIWQSAQDAANSLTYTPWTQVDGKLRP